jgi:membrane protease YdiL (CAAX protease family)
METAPTSMIGTASAKPTAFKQALARRPIAAYFLIAYAGTWLFQLPILLGQDGLGFLPYQVPFGTFAVLFILSAYCGPTLGAFLVTNAMEGNDGRRKLFRRYFQWRVGIVWYLAAIFLIPLLYLAAISLAEGSLPEGWMQAGLPAFFTTYLPALLIFPALITWGEEPGWRGFALTRLQERYNPVVSTLVVGFLHGLWHLPIYLMVSGPVAAGPFNLARFLNNILVSMALAFVFTWIFNHARGSILIAVLVHASSNAATGWMAAMAPTFPENLETYLFGSYYALAILLVIVTRGRLGYKSKTDPEA